MVRIHRNDAPPEQTVNLVSDEEEEPSNSSPTSSNSSNSSSSDSEQKPVNPSFSSLSDFIEDDDEPPPNLRSSSSSWEPITPQRKRLRTLRKKPRLDKIDADNENSTSSDSTSSEGIPRPEVELDADDEEDQVETTPTWRTPKKRKRPRRAAAPPCLLDALNKFVEPMSKEALKYQALTLSQMLYGESDDQEQKENSDDSSVECVPCTPAKNVARVNCESAESDGSRENDCDAEKNHQNADNVGSSRKRRRPPKQTRTKGSPLVRLSSPTQKRGGNLSTIEDRNSRRLTKRPRASMHLSKRRRRGEHDASLDSPYMEEQEARSNELEGERRELRELNDQEPTERHLQNSNKDESHNAPKADKFEGEVIDLCSGNECEATTFKDKTHRSRGKNIHRKGNLIAEHTTQERVFDIAMADLPTPEERFEYDEEDKPRSKNDDMSTLKVAEPYSFPQNEFVRPCSKRSSMGHDEGVDFDMMEAREKHESTPFPQARPPQEGSKPGVIDSKSWDSERKIESQPQRCGEEAGCDPIKERNRKQKIDMKTVENCKSSDLVSKTDPLQTHSISPRNLGDDIKPDNPGIVRLGPRHRFNCAKQRRNTHPDVSRKRVPQSQEEIRAWLAFVKAEARDIHRGLTGDVSARRYRCANIDMVFVRQILAELGRLMGLKVHSEKDGDGRRIILEKYPRGSIRGTEQEAEQAVEGFFYDALTDLTSDLRNSKQKLDRIPEMKDVNEPSKTSSDVTEKDQGMGKDCTASSCISLSRASNDCNRKRGGKGKHSPRVVGKGPRQKKTSQMFEVEL